MPDWLTLHVAGLILVAALFGSMLFFAALFTPLVFRTLPAETAADFMRALFPACYRVMGIVAMVAAVPLVPAQSYVTEVAMLAVVAAGFVIANTVLRPRIDRARQTEHDAVFRRLHRISVGLYLGQLALVTVVLVRLAQ